MIGGDCWLSKVTHDCDSEFLQTCSLIDFQRELTAFASPGSSETTLAKAKGKKGKSSSSGAKGAAKLVDVTQLRAKFIVKITSVVRMSKAHVHDALDLFVKYRDNEESTLIQKFNRNLTCFIIETKFGIICCGSGLLDRTSGFWVV